jgi:hypothetical protein
LRGAVTRAAALAEEESDEDPRQLRGPNADAAVRISNATSPVKSIGELLSGTL